MKKFIFYPLPDSFLIDFFPVLEMANKLTLLQNSFHSIVVVVVVNHPTITVKKRIKSHLVNEVHNWGISSVQSPRQPQMKPKAHAGVPRFLR